MFKPMAVDIRQQEAPDQDKVSLKWRNVPNQHVRSTLIGCSGPHCGDEFVSIPWIVSDHLDSTHPLYLTHRALEENG